VRVSGSESPFELISDNFHNFEAVSPPKVIVCCRPRSQVNVGVSAPKAVENPAT